MKGMPRYYAQIHRPHTTAQTTEVNAPGIWQALCKSSLYRTLHMHNTAPTTEVKAPGILQALCKPSVYANLARVGQRRLLRQTAEPVLASLTTKYY